ncbi:MAG: hypothetical protein Ct9H90mP27_5150 [Gammaproteobacteria bacterium]|nr:MAG: hypothetical protein Ct9H90mP27_5150 [Gammaproteobacteria bacterium]
MTWLQNDQKLMDDLLNNKSERLFGRRKAKFLDAIVGSEFSYLINFCRFHVVHAADARGRRWPREPMSFGRSKTKLLSEGQIKTTFADVAA